MTLSSPPVNSPKSAENSQNSGPGAGPASRARGLVLTTLGVLILTPDTLLIRLVDLDPFTLMVWRGLLQALGTTAILFILYRSRTWESFRAVGRRGLFAAVAFTGSTFFFVLALHATSVANTLVIIAAAPLCAALMSRIFLGESIAGRTWAAIFGALAGIAILAWNDLGAGQFWGNLFALAGAFCLAGNFTILRHSKAVNMIPSMAIGGVMVALLALPFADFAALVPPGPRLGYLLIMGLVVLPASFALIALGPRSLPAAEVALILLLETVLGPLWVWLVIEEYPGNWSLIGGAIVVTTLVAHALTANGKARSP